MKKEVSVLVLLVPLMILGIFPGQNIPRAHAATTGLVCIAAISDVSAGKCPTLSPSFNGPVTTPNSLLRVPVMINSTDTFNGFDITVNSTRDSAGHSVLKPYGVDLTGSVMPAGSQPLVECVGSTSILGSSCGVNATIDNPTTVRAAVISLSSFLPIGTTGLLFTAIFSINGTSAVGGVTIGFQNHCDPYPSASSKDHLCISISNGTTSSAPENVNTGAFDNSDITTLPYATLSTTSANLGQSLIGSPAHALPRVMYTATSQNGFQTSTAPQLTLAVSFNGTGTRPTAALNMTSLDLTGLAAHPFNQTGNVPANVPVGIYVATVTATYTTSDLITFTTDYLSAVYALPFNMTDYVFGSSASTVTAVPPASQTVTVTVSPKASFNNLVKLGITIPQATATAGIGATFNAYTISGGSGSSTLTITTSANTPGGSYSLTVTSNSTLNGFTVTHSTTLTMNTGFTITATNPPANPLGAAATSTITVTFLSGFTGPVTLTNTTATDLICNPLTPTSLSATGTATMQCLSNVKGTYTLTITGHIGPDSISTTVTFNFTLQVHDVAIGATGIITPSTSTTVGSKVTVNVQIQNKGAQSENVTVYLLVDNLTLPAPQTLIIPANSNQNVTFTWDTTSYTAKTYTLSVTVQLQNGETNKESGQRTLNTGVGTYTLNSAPSQGTLDLTTIAIIAGIVVAIVIVGTLLALRMRKKSNGSSQQATM